MKALWKKDDMKKRIFLLQPWIPWLLQIFDTGKQFDKNPGNFDTKKRQTIYNKKKKRNKAGYTGQDGALGVTNS